MKIMLDAGHGYNTQGKRSPDGMREYEFNRAVANYAKSVLDGYENTTVYFAHSDSADVPLVTRTNRANELKVDVFVSIHANAFGAGGWDSASGIETFVYTSKPKEAYDLAIKVQNNLLRASGLPNRGVKTANFHVLRETHMTAILAECGFMTNKTDQSKLKSESYRKAAAEAIVNALAAQYGLKHKPVPKPQPKPVASSGKLYKVQVGAFSDRNNADKLAAELKSKGYPITIVIE